MDFHAFPDMRKPQRLESTHFVRGMLVYRQPNMLKAFKSTCRGIEISVSVHRFEQASSIHHSAKAPDRKGSGRQRNS